MIWGRRTILSIYFISMPYCSSPILITIYCASSLVFTFVLNSFAMTIPPSLYQSVGVNDQSDLAVAEDGCAADDLGLIDVFYNLDLEYGITLSNAGIGIGGSMICLVFSLIVAISSMILFWFFNINIQDISDKIDGYIVDLLHIFYRNMDKIAGGQNVNVMYNDNNQIKQEMQEQQTARQVKPAEQQKQNEPQERSESSTEDDV